MLHMTTKELKMLCMHPTSMVSALHAQSLGSLADAIGVPAFIQLSIASIVQSDEALAETALL